MSLMFAKQFSEAGASSSSGRKGGRGKGSGMMAKSKRKQNQEDLGDNSSGGLFNMEGNGPYRTHMLFPGRKEEEGGGDPRRSSGSPGFMKQMMSWGKRPSDPRGLSGQEMQRYRATPTRTESELDPLTRKTVSFEEGVISNYPANPQSADYLNPGLISPYHSQGSPFLSPSQGRSSPYTPSIHSRGTNSPYTPTNQVVSAYPNNTNPRQNGQNPYYPYSEPFRESDYATFGKFDFNPFHTS